MKPNPPLTVKELMQGLSALPPKALLSRGTWHRLFKLGQKKVPRLGQAFTPGSVSELQGITTWSRDAVFEESERFRIAGFGLRSQSGGGRQWIIPLTVWQATGGTPDRTNYRPRAATLNGSLVEHMAEFITATDEIPALIGYMLPNGDWASTTAPEWRAVPEADPDRDYPALVSDPGEVVLTTLAASVLQFPTPLVYVSRY